MFRNSIVSLLSLMGICSVAQAYDCCNPCEPPCSSLYISAFGGGGQSLKTNIRQTGIAFLSDAEGGPLDVDARGSWKGSNAALGGANIGYRLQPQEFGGMGFTPAVELEGYYLTRLNNDSTGDLINELDTDRLPEHDFVNRLPMDGGVFLANGVLAFNIPNFCAAQLYVGGGIGAAKTWINGANSLQVSPLEADINHFNSKRNDSNWAFAAQAKVGLRYELTANWSVFAEYRYLHVNSSNYTFGDTRYPDHAPTTSWKVKVRSMDYNLGVAGIQFTL